MSSCGCFGRTLVWLSLLLQYLSRCWVQFCTIQRSFVFDIFIPFHVIFTWSLYWSWLLEVVIRRACFIHMSCHYIDGDIEVRARFMCTCKTFKLPSGPLFPETVPRRCPLCHLMSRCFCYYLHFDVIEFSSILCACLVLCLIYMHLVLYISCLWFCGVFVVFASDEIPIGLHVYVSILIYYV